MLTDRSLSRSCYQITFFWGLNLGFVLGRTFSTSKVCLKFGGGRERENKATTPTFVFFWGGTNFQRRGLTSTSLAPYYSWLEDIAACWKCLFHQAYLVNLFHHWSVICSALNDFLNLWCFNYFTVSCHYIFLMGCLLINKEVSAIYSTSVFWKFILIY